MTVSFAWVAVIAALLTVRPLEAANADVTIEDGVYQGIVLGVDPSTPEPADGTAFLNEIKGFLQAGSGVLHSAIGASFGDVKLVLPRSWDKTKFGGTVMTSEPKLTIASSDILLHDTPDTLPSTLQSEQCGVPGRQIEIPVSYLSLTEEEETIYGTTGSILAHEWAHYRYGVHDEHGYTGDSVFKPAYGSDDAVTGCSVGKLTGVWRPSCSSDLTCRPNVAGCYFCRDESLSANSVQASLGYLPALSSGKFCDALTHNRDAPSPQNTRCEQRSVMEVIRLHPDHQSMNSEAAVPAINVAVYEEPLGRVMLVLDTPPAAGEVLSYAELMTNLEVPLTQYSSLTVAMVSFKPLANDEVQLDNLRTFATIPEGGYDSLVSLLPQKENRVSVPDLGQVLTKILELNEFADEYSPGTLLVIPATTEIMGASKLDETLGATLRSRHIKPLLLFPEVSPDLTAATSFIQHSGARFVARNDTDGPLEYASMVASDEIFAFIDNTFQNDHAIVKVDKAEILPGGYYTSQLWYEGSIAQHRFAVLTTTGNINDLKLQYIKFGSYADCNEDNFCSSTGDAIVFRQSSKQSANFPTREWHLQVNNTGTNTAQITLTRSVMNFVQETEQELSVEVWSSDGRGPVAYLPQNAQCALYASVLKRGKQVLGSNINVLVDVSVQKPDEALEEINGLHLLDNGASADLRKDDSVFSAFLAAEEFPSSTVVTVKSVTVASHTILGELTPDSSTRRRREVLAATTGLFTGRPEDEECCGSFVQDPNVELSHASRGYYLQLSDPIPSIEIKRVVVTPISTEAPPSTTSSKTDTPPATTSSKTNTPPDTTAPGTGAPSSSTISTSKAPNTGGTTKPPSVTTTTRAPTTTAGVAPLETSLLSVAFQTAAALCLAKLMGR